MQNLYTRGGDWMRSGVNFSEVFCFRLWSVCRIELTNHVCVGLVCMQVNSPCGGQKGLNARFRGNTILEPINFCLTMILLWITSSLSVWIQRHIWSCIFICKTIYASEWFCNRLTPTLFLHLKLERTGEEVLAWKSIIQTSTGYWPRGATLVHHSACKWHNYQDKLPNLFFNTEIMAANWMRR